VILVLPLTDIGVPSNFGWIVAIGWAMWQIYAPKWFGVDTRFQEIVKGFNERFDRVGNRLDNIESRQDDHVRVTEIIAVETENVNGGNVIDILNDEESISHNDLTHDSHPYPSADKEPAD